MVKPLTKSILEKLIREEIETGKIGVGTTSRSSLAKAEREKSKEIAKGNSLDDVTGRERSVLRDIEEILTYVAENDDLYRYKAVLEAFFNRIMKKSKELEAKAKQKQDKV